MPLTPAQLLEQSRDHQCQTPTCPNLYDLIILRARDGGGTWVCWTCALPFMTTLVEGMVNELAPEIAAQVAAPPGT